LVALTQIILIFRNAENQSPTPKKHLNSKNKFVCKKVKTLLKEIFRENVFYFQKWKLELFTKKRHVVKPSLILLLWVSKSFSPNNIGPFFFSSLVVPLPGVFPLFIHLFII
jgi:hypothetical protein